MKLVQKISVITIVVGLVLAFVSAFIISAVVQSQFEKQIGQQEFNEAQRGIDIVDRIIESRIQEVNVIAGEEIFYEFLNGSPVNTKDDAESRFDELLSLGLYDAFVLIDEDSIVRAVSDDFPLIGLSPELPEHQVAVETALNGDSGYSVFHVSRITGHSTVSIAAPVEDIVDGQRVIRGVLLVEISWPAVSETLEAEQTYTYILNTDGGVVSSKGLGAHEIPLPEGVVTKALTGFSGWDIMKIDEEGSFLVATVRQRGYLEFYGYNWSLVTLTSVEDAFSTIPIVTFTVASLIITFSLVTALFMIWALTSFVVGPLSRLSKDMEEVEDGHLDRRSDINSKDEVGAVATSFNEMTSTIQQNERNLIHLQTLIDSSPTIAMTLKNSEGFPISYIGGNLDMLGYRTKEDLEGSVNFLDSVHPNDVEIFHNSLKDFTKKRLLHFSVELRILARNAEYKWLNFSVWPKKDGSGEMTHLNIVAVDVTERRNSENSIRQEKNRLALILRSIGDAVVVIDKDKRIVLTNPIAEKFTGFSENEMKGLLYSDVVHFVHEKSKKPSFEFIDWVFEHGMLATGEGKTVLVKKDGTTMAVAETAAPLVGEQTEVVGAVIAFRNVTKEREVDRMKSEFVSVASHQLKTPLNRMGWFLEMMAEGDFAKLNQEELGLTQEMIFSNKQMIALIKNLLDISRMDKGEGVTLDLQVFNFNNIINDSKKELTRYASDHNKTLSFKTDATDGIELMADESKIHEIVKNFATNAIKYSKDRGEVVITTELNKHDVIVSVSDNGIGIPSIEQEHMFERFYRASNAVSQEAEGTGLGLSVARSFAEAHGGRVWFESEEGKGSTFHFTIPRNLKKPN